MHFDSRHPVCQYETLSVWKKRAEIMFTPPLLAGVLDLSHGTRESPLNVSLVLFSSDRTGCQLDADFIRPSCGCVSRLCIRYLRAYLMCRG